MARSSIEKWCVPPGAAVDASSLILSVNGENPQAAMARQEQARLGKIELGQGFVAQAMEPGDCVLFDSGEQLSWEVGGVKRDFSPVVFFRQRDAAKRFGLLALPARALLKRVGHDELSTKTILSFSGRHRDLTLLYVLCPRLRDGPCRLRIRHRGKWDAKVFRVWGRASSRQRIAIGGDTPQGIYYIWASMFSEGGFAGEPRIDLDAAMPPVNVFPYNINSYVLSEIVPEAALDDYWANEWALAYQLGRVHLRIHGTADPSATTQGCLSAAAEMPALLKKLRSLGLFEEKALRKTPPSDPATLGWTVSPRIGRAFLIVKDE